MVPSALGRSNRWFAVVLAGSLVGCGGADLTLPSDALPASLTAVSGSGQQGVVGTELPKPLVVRVTDGAGRPVEQASLRFETQVRAAQILSTTDIRTDQTGHAEVRVRLGATEGIQAFDAEVPGASDLRVTFNVIAVAAPDDGGDQAGGGGDQVGGGGDQAGGGGDDHGNDQDHGNGNGGNGNGGNGAGKNKDSGGGHGGDGHGEDRGRDHEHGNHGDDDHDHGHGHGHGHNGEKEKD